MIRGKQHEIADCQHHGACDKALNARVESKHALYAQHKPLSSYGYFVFLSTQVPLCYPPRGLQFQLCRLALESLLALIGFFLFAILFSRRLGVDESLQRFLIQSLFLVEPMQFTLVQSYVLKVQHPEIKQILEA